ncbi:hypothetical protein [Streptomyces gilvosporeus]|uniref:Uncharacterized protein n=1 Tax=Streptomyces gilvosporeus TaxID=553510 RepID=A0A1V0TZ42_9ACTN|nr:hypothetical protein [Streptomyces gilvosporeus]ARF58249.1 hypothetical protein B1H19_32365 [Streptomyces gilvosporeus]
MHPVARGFQILLLVGGLFMLFVAATTTGHHGTDSWRCETRAKRDDIDPHQEQTCNGGGTDDSSLVLALAGVGLTIGSVSISIGGRRTPATGAAAVPAAPQQPYLPQQFPVQQPGQQPVQPQGQPPAQPQPFQGTPPQQPHQAQLPQNF